MSYINVQTVSISETCNYQVGKKSHPVDLSQPLSPITLHCYTIGHEGPYLELNGFTGMPVNIALFPNNSAKRKTGATQ